MGNNNNNNGGKGSGILIALIIVALLGLLGSCGGEEDHDDGKCDICGKSATYSNSREEYCSKHSRDAAEWYMEQMLEED